MPVPDSSETVLWINSNQTHVYELNVLDIDNADDLDLHLLPLATRNGDKSLDDLLSDIHCENLKE